MKSLFLQNLPRQLSYWAIHCSVNAIPSLMIALIWLELYQKPEAIVAMISAIATFIVGYAVVTSLPGPLSQSDHLMARAMRRGATIRQWISVLSIPFAAVQQLVFFTPDCWLGLASVAVTNSLLGNSLAQVKTFLPVYMATMIEGVLISLLLWMIAFFSLLVMQAKLRHQIITPQSR